MCFCSTPKIFTAVADTVEWITRKKGVELVGHYLDHFLVMVATDTEECSTALGKLHSTSEDLGLPVVRDKMEGPDTTLTLLGSELDSGKVGGSSPLEEVWRAERVGPAVKR